MKTIKSIEDYLEAILMLEQKNESIKSIRVAEMLGVSRPAVNQAMKELITMGYIDKPDYSKISLTKKGREIALDTLERHILIKKFLISLGVCDEIAEIDCCKIEHILSKETLEAIKKANNKQNK